MKLNMDWQNYVDKSYNMLKSDPYQIFSEESFNKEQDLTRCVVIGLRRLFADCFGINPDDKQLHYHVIYRQGDSYHDKIAWNKSKGNKWIICHGVRFVPDILVLHDDNVLPIEVKLIKKPGSAQAIATSIGQAIIYSSIYPESLVFIGIKGSITWGRYKLRSNICKEDEILYQRLSENNVRLIMREVN